jgi:hypothetical protein
MIPQRFALAQGLSRNNARIGGYGRISCGLADSGLMAIVSIGAAG